MPMLETARGTFFYKDYRKEDIAHPPIILVHGAGGVYLGMPIALRQTMQTIAFDLSGHGCSMGDGRRHIQDYAADVVALLDALNIDKAIIGGHSMGGAIAQTIALDFPNRVVGLMLFGTGAYLPVNQIIIDGLANDFEQTCQKLIKWQWHKSAPESYRQQGLERLLKTQAHITRNDYLACNEFDMREQIDKITVPTLIVAADSDKMLPLTQSQFLAENILNAKLVVLENAGHMFTLEQPDKLVEVVQEWLKTNFQM